ncbi:MAG: PAS domain S-box protein, partial [Chloroflexi bacterium]|nr:PAS domain S-box protein [Chloroflexota bacterium]
TLNGEVITNEEWVLRRPDGEQITVLCNAGPVRDDQGAITGGVIVWRDITGRKHTEAQLAYQADLLANVSDAVIATDAQFRITTWNLAAEALYGWKAAEVLGLPAQEIVRSELTTAERAEILRMLAERGRYDLTTLLYRKDGRPMWVEGTSTALRDAAGQITGYIAVHRDITAHKQAEEVLRRQAALLDQSYDAVFAWELDGPIMYWNQGAERLYDIPPAAAVGRIPYELLRTVFPVSLQDCQDTLARTGRWEGELDHQMCDGRRMVVESRMALVREAGRTLVLEANRDITARQQAEEALRRARDELEQRVQARTAELVQLNAALQVQVAERQRTEAQIREREAELAEAQHIAHLGSWQWYIPSDTVTWSDELYHIYGLEPRSVEITYGTFLERVHPEDREFVNTVVNRAYRDHQPFSFEHRILRPDGSVRYLHAQGQVIVGEDGQPVRMTGTGQDITERKMTEEALHESRRMFEGLFESAPDAIVGTNREGRILLYNRQAEALFDYQRGEVLGQSVELLIPEAFRHRHREHRAGYVAEPRVRPMGAGLELYARRKDGTVFPVDIMLGPVSTGKDTIVLTLIRDITARQQAEKALQAYSEQLKTLNRQLVAVQETERRNIARELHDEAGQLLTSLAISLRLLEKELDNPQARSARLGELRQLTDTISAHLHRLATDLRPPLLERLGLVAALRQHLATYANQHGIEAQFETVGWEDVRLPPEIGITIYRIVQEALTNAARHAHASRVGVLLERRQDQLMVLVEDNGVGFDPDAAWQKGRLGLLGIRERTEMLGGNLTVESEAGKGTTLFVEIPVS